MVFFQEKFEALGCKWNEKELKEVDFYRLCKRHKITVIEMPLRVSGFYYLLLGRHYIAVNSRLKQPKKLFVLFHEFAHYLLHAPDRGVTANFHGIGRRTRKEFEADVFAVCAMIPRPMVEGRSLDELVEHYGFPEELVRQRFDVLGKLSL